MVRVPRPRDGRPIALVAFSVKSTEIVETLRATIPGCVGITVLDVHISTILVNKRLAEDGGHVAVYYDEPEKRFYTSHLSAIL